MTAENLYEAISEISSQYIEEADIRFITKRKTWKRVLAAAACLLLCFSFSVPALAAADNSFAYELLYSVSPAFAQKLKPVRETCEDNGIKMEVVAANLEGDTVNILLAMQDMTGNRITASSDLMDSYSINTPYDQTAGCHLEKYDGETGTALWAITIDQDESKLKPGDKITFSVSEILSKKEHTEMALDSIIISDIREATEFAIDPRIRGCAGYYDENDIESTPLLLPAKTGYQLCDGVMLTGTGLVDGKLHIQVKYDDILNTDNHGYAYLKSSSGEIINYNYSVSFWADNKADSYEEYVFDIAYEELADCEVMGEFWTCKNAPIEGSWQVTFPISQ